MPDEPTPATEERAAVEEIARRLTEAQRNAVLSATRSTAEVSYRFREGGNPTIRALFNLGVSDWHQRQGARLTPLGKRLRTHLENSEDA